MSLLGFLPCGLVVLGLAAVLAVIDVRTGRGYALCILSSLLLVCTVVIVAGVAILAQTQPPPTSPHTFSVTIWLFFYFVPAAYATAVALLGAAIVAYKAGHGRWLAALGVSALVPVLLAIPPVAWLDGSVGMLVVPQATALAYSIRRLVHPVWPAAPRQVTPEVAPPT